MDDVQNNAETGSIKPISKKVVHQICSGQVILTLAIAIKELVENSIDAGATIIDIALKEYGSEVIEVSDNGNGVLEDNFQALTLKHYTSKIKDFSDLQCLETLGFRGEALSSLCALADLSILTKHSSVEEAKRIKYDKDGKITDITLAARQTGTTVTLENLFATLPVRRKEFMKNLKREFNKMCQLLYAYCLVSKGIKFTCTNTTNRGSKNIVVATQGLNKIKENIISVFGGKQISTLIDVELVRPNESICEEFNIKFDEFDADNKMPFKFEFLISSVTHGTGRSSTDRQFFYINWRPVEPTKIIKLVNQIYKQFNVNQYPFVYLNIILANSIVDVNVTPDKRQIFLEKEKLFLATIKMSLLESFKLFPSQLPKENQDISQFLTTSNINQERKGLKRSLTASASSNKSFLNSFRKKAKSDNNVGYAKITNFVSVQKVDDEVFSNQKSQELTNGVEINSLRQKTINLDESPLDKTICVEVQSCQLKKGPDSAFSMNAEEEGITDFDISTQEILESAFEEIDEEKNCSVSTNVLYEKICEYKSEPKCFGNIATINYNSDQSVDSEMQVTYNFEKIEGGNLKKEILSEKRSSDNDDIQIILDAPSDKSINRRNVHLDISLDSIRESLENNALEESMVEDIKVKFRSTISPENNKNAEEELQKQLSKNDFSNMTVIGQFNLGFIITKLENDLFIIDQHATDEKYNFEQLQSSTVMQKQFLVNPKPLELTAGNEGILIENEEIFKKNGFHFKIDQSAPSMKKVMLTAIPVSQNFVFGKDDIDEMLFMLKDSSHTMCRPSRVRAMFASRACRKSVMIGKSLSSKDMRILVDHMGEIEQPWNCPHGRPTIRHLINLGLLVKDGEQLC